MLLCAYVRWSREEKKGGENYGELEMFFMIEIKEETGEQKKERY